ncbi:hypothetical protein GCM10009745_24420 [Kribbella yunnanensis]|uniref:Uncharacterized protein n=1 Tax=Kribbella yunnanensis TaxID=190194 RepID=A0ABP4SZ55_9ACTN
MPHDLPAELRGAAVDEWTDVVRRAWLGRTTKFVALRRCRRTRCSVTWFKVDDAFAFHLKVIRAGNSAIGLWVRAGSWSAQQLTDGLVPADMVQALGGNLGDAEQLVTVGLWEESPGGYKFHDWHDYQPSKAEVESDRERARKRKQEWRENKRSAVRPPVRPSGTHAGTPPGTDSVTDARTNGGVTPTPTRPARPGPKEPGSGGVLSTTGLCNHWNGRLNRANLSADGECLRCKAGGLCAGCVKTQLERGPASRCSEHPETVA